MNDFTGIFSDTHKRIVLEATTADLSVGGDGRGGDIIVKDSTGKARIRLDAGGEESTGQALVLPPTPRVETILLAGATGDIEAGGWGQSGSVTVKSADGAPMGFLQSTALGGQGLGGTLLLNGPDGKQRITANGLTGQITAGGHGNPVIDLKSGRIEMDNIAGKRRVLLDGSGANLWLGGQGEPGDLMLFDSGETDNLDHTKATVWLSGYGSLILKSAAGQEIVRLTAQPDGDNISIQDASGKRLLAFDNEAFGNTRAGLFLGAHVSHLPLDPKTGKPVDGKPGYMALRDDGGNDSIILDGSKGDVFLQNADCAEDFDVSDSESGVESTDNGAGSDTSGTAALPGTVMVLAEDGRLRPSSRPYDKAVAGVVSGAGDWKPGIILDRQPRRRARVPIALMGKVYCNVDADHSAVSVGDLLTTSPTPGHAMKASDPVRAFGAVIGKALRPLTAGRGLVPILVALQ